MNSKPRVMFVDQNIAESTWDLFNKYDSFSLGWPTIQIHKQWNIVFGDENYDDVPHSMYGLT